MASYANQPDFAQPPPAESSSAHTQEHEKRERNQSLCFLPKWPRYAAVSLHLLVMSSSIAIVILVAHSIRTFFHTRNIKFGGTNASWPKDLNLQPAYFFLAIASISLAVSLGSSLYSFLRRNSLIFSIIDAISAVGTVLLMVLWITGNALQYQSEKTPKRDVLSWSCRRSESPTNTLVGYASTCAQQASLRLSEIRLTLADYSQEAIKYLAIFITVVEVLLLACLAGTYQIARNISKKLEESFS